MALIMIDMEMPKHCEINDFGTGEFAECPLLYDANDCKLFADTRCREWLEGWAIESDNCPLKEIVLCKDCKYFAEVDPAETYAHCPHMRETDFCSLGERREE